LCPIVEKFIIDGGVQLIKIWLEVSPEEQKKRFIARIQDPMRHWKLSPTDLESIRLWYDYSRARDKMLEATDTKHSPWAIVRSDDKKRARLNTLAYLLEQIDYGKVPAKKIKLPKRSEKNRYDDQASLEKRKFIPEKY